MAKMVVIYNMPKDTEAFNKHYFEVHVPLAKKLQGLIKYEVSRGSVIPVVKGGPAIHLIGTLYFDNLDAIKTAFATPEGQACAADRRILAPTDVDVKIYLFDTQVV
jgi:uncharacterized protein (TIGR02118 family)